jgi:hypothetical protein
LGAQGFPSTQKAGKTGLQINVWLPDFKFGPGRCAIKLARTPRYGETVTRRLTQTHDWGEDLTIRHLVMPDHVECCTYPVIDWLAENMAGNAIQCLWRWNGGTFATNLQAIWGILSRGPRRLSRNRAHRCAHGSGACDPGAFSHRLAPQ